MLGPSGCGKTTLLKCIVGKLKVDSGSVVVFGQTPGTPGCGVPGSRVGYMPQELALFGEFNIAETLRYFSRLYAMSYQKYKVCKYCVTLNFKQPLVLVAGEAGS